MSPRSLIRFAAYNLVASNCENRSIYALPLREIEQTFPVANPTRSASPSWITTSGLKGAFSLCANFLIIPFFRISTNHLASLPSLPSIMNRYAVLIFRMSDLRSAEGDLSSTSITAKTRDAS